MLGFLLIAIFILAAGLSEALDDDER